jgi:hypothetical protein
MEVRRATYGAAIRLALVFSVVAAVAALTLDAIGDVSTSRMLVAVVAVGFTTSWVQTGRVAASAATAGSHESRVHVR